MNEKTDMFNLDGQLTNAALTARTRNTDMKTRRTLNEDLFLTKSTSNVHSERKQKEVPPNNDTVPAAPAMKYQILESQGSACQISSLKTKRNGKTGKQKMQKKTGEEPADPADPADASISPERKPQL